MSNFDDTIRQFEESWTVECPPDIGDYLGNDDSILLLAELAMVDLENRLRAGQEVRAESYIEQFPRLSSANDQLLEIARHEFGIRQSLGHKVSIDGYVSRFPALADRLKSLPSDSQSRRLRIGELIGDRYKISSFHARGGLGSVWRAEDLKLNRQVAVKEIREDLVDSHRLQRRLDQEALITGNLEHPGIIPIYDRGTLTNGAPYYAMRWVEGTTLSDVIRSYHQGRLADRKSALRGLVSRVVDVCNTIEYAHSRQVIHRDIKPANVLVGEYGETIVGDWGLAKSLTPQSPEADRFESDARVPANNGLTQVGDVMGSYGYMSPEQRSPTSSSVGTVSYTHLTLPTNREV